MAWLYLALAIAFEASWALAMKASEGYSRLGPTVGVLVLSLFSIGFLGLAAKRLDLSVAYAIWTGLGGALVAVCSVFWFDEAMTPGKLVSLALILAGVAGLHLTGLR